MADFKDNIKKAVESSYERPNQAEAGTFNVSGADLVNLLREARRPDPDTQAELDEKKRIMAENRARLRETIESARKMQRAHQDACSHEKWDPVAQVNRGSAVTWQRHNGDRHSGPFETGICVRCQKEFRAAIGTHPEAGGVIAGVGYQVRHEAVGVE